MTSRRHRDPLDLDELRTSHGGGDALALSAADQQARAPIYSRSGGGFATPEPPPAPRVDPAPPPFEPAREFNPVRAMSGGAPQGDAVLTRAIGQSEERPPEYAWRTSWDEAKPWWVVEHEAAEIERGRAEVREAHTPDPYHREYTPPPEDWETTAIFQPDWDHEWLARAREQMGH